MHIIAPLKSLIRLAERCAAAADTKASFAALKTVLIEGKGTTIRLVGTDLYMSVEGQIDATAVPVPGGMCLPASGLVERLKALPAGDVEIMSKPEGSTAVVLKSVGTKRSFMLHGMPLSEYPPRPTLPEPLPPPIKISATTLASLIRMTRFAISTDETRSHVNSAFFDVCPTLVRMVSTDGHRLCKAEVERSAPGAAQTPVLIPLKAIALLARILSEAETSKEEVMLDLWFDKSSIFIGVGNLQYSAKLVDAKFPPYEQVIPARDPSLEMRVHRSLFISLLRAVAVGSDKTNQVTLTLKKGMVYATSVDFETGDAADEMPVDYLGPDIAVNLNASYIDAVLSCITSDEITIGFTQSLDPVVVRPVAPPQGSEYVGLIMPMSGK